MSCRRKYRSRGRNPRAKGMESFQVVTPELRSANFPGYCRQRNHLQTFSSWPNWELSTLHEEGRWSFSTVGHSQRVTARPSARLFLWAAPQCSVRLRLRPRPAQGAVFSGHSCQSGWPAARLHGWSLFNEPGRYTSCMSLFVHYNMITLNPESAGALPTWEMKAIKSEFRIREKQAGCLLVTSFVAWVPSTVAPFCSLPRPCKSTLCFVSVQSH